jgi:hypothetical protein
MGTFQRDEIKEVHAEEAFAILGSAFIDELVPNFGTKWNIVTSHLSDCPFRKLARRTGDETLSNALVSIYSAMLTLLLYSDTDKLGNQLENLAEEQASDM